MKYESVADCYYDILNESLTTKRFHYIETVLPEEINQLAEYWGWNDTEVRDKVFVWVNDNKEKFK